MRKFIPVLFALVGLGGGAGVGLMLRPVTPDVHAAPTGGELSAGDDTNIEEGEAAPDGDAQEARPNDEDGEAVGPEYVKLSNQFIVPVVENGRVASMVILSLSLEVTSGSTEAVFAIEPKLRDRFLQVLFDHANAGGFKGSFTDGANLVVLRRTLKETARIAAGDMILDVLIADIARQDS